ncbi:hypothetical protein MPSEU_000286200 [Mayamaea pseudoterrestris]|nr:hypothetical protein MPSEU_000286200 [Mayamaea pseudoterrestris]
MNMFPGAAGAAAGALAEEKDDGKMLDLRDKIDSAMSYAKNEASGYPMSNLFIGDSRLGCKSDTDEQMIIHIEFQEFVKLRSIKWTEYNNGIDPESNPSKVHLYVNRANLGFEDCEDVEATQTIQLTAEDLKENAPPTQLKYVKFQRVKTLTIFIEDNQGGEVSALGGIKFFGRPVDNVNMADFKKQPEN